MSSPAAPRVLAVSVASASLAAIVVLGAGCNEIIGLAGPAMGDGSSDGDTGSRRDSMCAADPGSNPDAGPRSCEPGGPGLNDCPASGGGESCCISLSVPAGSYDRTYTNTGDGGTGRADLATVSGFRLDKYEVTLARFAPFVSAWNNGCGWKPAPGSGKHTHLNGGLGLENASVPGQYEPGWVASDDAHIAPTSTSLGCDPNYATWSSRSTSPSLPINCVNWWEAYAFCIWDGGFLPSEAEWEYAAAGGSLLREYPWGTAPPGTSNQYAIYACHYPAGMGKCTGVAFIAPVGNPTLGAGVWGQLDLAGNVSEWNLDTYATYVEPCSNCAHLGSAPNRVFRGGDFEGPLRSLSPHDRDQELPAKRGYRVGFRCARVP